MHSYTQWSFLYKNHTNLEIQRSWTDAVCNLNDELSALWIKQDELSALGINQDELSALGIKINYLQMNKI